MNIDALLANYAIAAAVFAAAVFAYLAIKQLMEVAGPKDRFTKLRWIFFFVFILCVVGFVPRVSYNYMRSQGRESVTFRRVSSFAASTTTVAIVGLFLLGVHTRIKGEDE